MREGYGTTGENKKKVMTRGSCRLLIKKTSRPNDFLGVVSFRISSPDLVDSLHGIYTTCPVWIDRDAILIARHL